jgi:hypothetical protein
MTFEKVVSAASRLFFLGAFLLLALAVLERIANACGYTILKMYSGGRLLEFSVVLVIFVIAMQLRAMREELKKTR